MLTFLKAGIYTTVQDAGRFSGAHLGIPISGPMDAQSAKLANLTLENSENDALLECTFEGPTIKFHEPTFIAIKGAAITVYLNDKIIDHSGAIQVIAEDTLSFGRVEKGCRFYIAVKGGIQSDVVFGSRSTCLTAGILKPMAKGDQLNYKPYSEVSVTSFSLNRIVGNSILNVSKGPEFSILNAAQKNQLLAGNYTILPSSNRMAYRVKHSIDLAHSYSMLSSGTLPGTVQLTPSGDVICLMRDTQTTGGYLRILQLTEEAICDLAQLAPNEIFKLKLIEIS